MGLYQSRAEEILGLKDTHDTIQANYAAIITASQNRQLELDRQLAKAIDDQDHRGITRLIKMGAQRSGEGVTPRNTKKFVQDFLGLKQS